MPTVPDTVLISFGANLHSFIPFVSIGILEKKLKLNWEKFIVVKINFDYSELSGKQLFISNELYFPVQFLEGRDVF